MPTLLNAIDAYTVILLRYSDEYLLLQRAPTKAWAPLRWTGVGGRVEEDEFSNLRLSALRELREETGFEESDVAHFGMRRMMLYPDTKRRLIALCYFTGDLKEKVTPDCPEGTLHWVAMEAFDTLDVVETTRQVLPLLVQDMHDDETATQPTKLGIGYYRQDGTFARIVWQDRNSQ